MDIYLALDIGEKKTGVAKSDTEGILATPLATVSTEELIEYLRNLQETYTIQKLVIGLPKNMDGTEGDQAKKVKEIANNIKSNFQKLDIVFEDERLTSEEAVEILRARGTKINQSNFSNKHLIDQYAAVVILEQFINHLAHNNR